MKKIIDLTPDNLNANRGTHLGMSLLKKSFNELGAGRSILIDKNDRITAGNKSAKTALDVGIDDVIVVETTGDEIIAVKRTDLDLDTKKGREMALADNSTSALNLEWGDMALQVISDKWEIDGDKWNVDIPNWDDDGFEPNLNPIQGSSLTTKEDIEKAQAKIDKNIDDKKKDDSLIDVVCPDCSYKFKIKSYE